MTATSASCTTPRRCPSKRTTTRATTPRWRPGRATTGHGVGRVERLDGGIGVLELTPILFPPSIAAEAVGAAFSELHDSAALVLDLRDCFGGDPEMVVFACTYLFGIEAVHLNDIVEQGGRETRQFWTLPYVPGPAVRARTSRPTS